MIDPLMEEARVVSGNESGEKGLWLAAQLRTPPRFRRGSAVDDDGFCIESLESGTTLAVQTVNSLYRIVILHGPRHVALIRGGKAFPEDALIRIEGATGRGSALKPGWIIVGLHMKFRLGALRIKSSEVCSVSIMNLP
jgi:hypothetical protein